MADGFVCEGCLQFHGHAPGCSFAPPPPAPPRRRPNLGADHPPHENKRLTEKLARVLMLDAAELEKFRALDPALRVGLLRALDRTLHDLRREFDPTFPAPVATAPALERERAWYEEQWSTACDES
jgi:hypothetical protein